MTNTVSATQGSHYKIAAGEQHHQRAIRLKLNWYAGNITKYAERAEHKGQLVEDLIKILDYGVMWLETQKLTTDQSVRLDTILERGLKMVPEKTYGGEAGPEYVKQDR